jgi:sulfotransferase famil protein
VPIVLKRYPITYHATPKVACTSIKLALYELEHGEEFSPWRDKNGTWKYIHDCWQDGTPYFTPVSMSGSYFKFAVVRDPFERFLSAFSNRVIYHGELGERYIKQGEFEGLKPNPSLSEFIRDFDRYRAASWHIRHHTDPQIYFLGKELSYYDRVFRFTELHEIAGALKTAVGAEITLPHEQTGGPKLSAAELSTNERRRIAEFYAKDYLLFGDIYKPA